MQRHGAARFASISFLHEGFLSLNLSPNPSPSWEDGLTHFFANAKTAIVSSVTSRFRVV